MNSIHTITTLLGNALDDDGWALIAPFGEHPKTRVVKKNGKLVEEKFIQVLDDSSADQLLSQENSLFRRIKRAIVGIPVYAGHPDLRDHSPETLVNRGARAGQIGVVDKVRKSLKGIEAHFVLSAEGATAVERDGAKYPSALWIVQPIGERGGAIVARPIKLLSVGLTAHPNISGVESLANAEGPGASETKEPDMKLIAGWLMAHGAALANAESPTETQVLEALQKLDTAKAGEVTSLGNEKTQAAGKITTLENQISEMETRISNLKTERTSHASAVVDLAIARGKLSIAERGARVQALSNAQEFQTAATALLGSATLYRTPDNTEGRKILSNQGTDGDPREEYCASVEKYMKETGENDPIKAHHAVMARNPGLAEKLQVRTQS
ncbi:MAG TPA: phage protease [Verrucomicrobiae bacterium]|nr:phage protease [Verrucomicrobiae bacterium]